MNKIQDFWMGDVAGLYGLCPLDTNEMIKLVEVSVAGADHNAIDKSAAPPAATPLTGMLAGQTFYATRAPKAGYWYRALTTDAEGIPYATAAGTGVGLTGAYFNTSRFGIESYPDSRSTGRNVFIVSEGNTIFKRGIINSYVVPASNQPTQHLGGTITVLTAFPTDDLIKSDYSKLD